MTQYKSLFFTLMSALFFCLGAESQATNQLRQTTNHAQSRQRVYVVPFTSRRPIDPNLLTRFTGEFERALTQSGCYDVLERTDIDQLIKQIRNEHNIFTIRDMGKTVSEQIRMLGATAVFFGEIDDDVDSGDVTVAAKMEYFSTLVAWNDSALMKRGLINDQISRVDTVRKLIHKLCPNSLISEPTPGSTPDISQTLLRGNTMGFEVQLKSCHRSGASVACNLTITNENTFRPFTLCAGDKTEFFDGKNRAFSSSRSSLVDKSSSTCVTAQLLQGKPAEAKLVFDAIPLDVSEGYLLRISLSTYGNWADLQLSGKIPIDNK